MHITERIVVRLANVNLLKLGFWHVAQRNANCRAVGRLRVPDRGPVNPSPLGDRSQGYGLSSWYGELRTRQPHGMGLQIPFGMDDKVPV